MQRPSVAISSTTTQSSESGETKNAQGHVMVTQSDIEVSQALQAAQAKQVVARGGAAGAGFTPYFAQMAAAPVKFNKIEVFLLSNLIGYSSPTGEA